MSDCCKPKPAVSCCGGGGDDHGHDHGSRRIDWMMAVCTPLILIPYVLAVMGAPVLDRYDWMMRYAHAVHDFVNATWWGVLVGIFFLAILSRIPREFIMAALGRNKGMGGIARAMLGGVLLDLCSHGILMVGTKLYQRGASIGQVMAFLIASPWNSISLTLIMISMIGFNTTMIFLLLSVVIAFISGVIFDLLVKRGVLPENPNSFDMPENFRFWAEAKRRLAEVRWTPSLFKSMTLDGIVESKMVVRWLLLGIVVAAVLRVFFTPESFSQYFGPSAIGLAATLFFATILEVCSEGSSPIAADLVTRAAAPGNAFAFLMAGVSTDYTEIAVLRETTKSWKIALFLPLITLPQIVILAVMLNASN